jgi:putative phosphoesterase
VKRQTVKTRHSLAGTISVFRLDDGEKTWLTAGGPSRAFRMHIAVISDTHDRFPHTLLARLRPADEIWHLGDVCQPELLLEFEQLGKPLHVVLGNNETHNLWPLSLVLEREGWKFFLTHIPPQRVPPGVNVVLHGHTHTPRDETDPGGVRWLNPGCISRPNRGAPPSFAWLNVQQGVPIGWRLMHL